MVLFSERRLPPPPEAMEVFMAKGKRGRDAGNGRFIPVKVAKARPKTTVVETVKKGKKSC